MVCSEVLLRGVLCEAGIWNYEWDCLFVCFLSLTSQDDTYVMLVVGKDVMCVYFAYIRL